jgi:hypothetical protein
VHHRVGCVVRGGVGRQNDSAASHGPTLLWTGAVAAVLGIAASVRFARLGLTLSHYDSRGHLVVARRIFDSITPGWQQIGAVWLPLPHLLNALPVQVDFLYRTGASAIVLSIAAFVITCVSIASVTLELTNSWIAAALGTAVFGVNPNVLYLQGTPMTEPLLLALTTASIALLIPWCRRIAGARFTSDHSQLATLAGWSFALACLTRYEAWPVTITANAAAVWVLWRGGLALTQSVRAVARIAVYPCIAILGFMIFSRIVIGTWFTSGFFVPENPAQGRPIEAVGQILWGLRELSGPLMLGIAAAGGAALAASAFVRGQAVRVLPLTLIGTAAVPWSAYLDGHPYRIRYAMPLIAAEAIFAAAVAGLWRRPRAAGALVLALAMAYELRPLALTAPMIVEAQWDQPNRPVRETVTGCLARDYHGETVMASMGSLGHYMQDLSRAGFSIRDILHEGNGDIWLNALSEPRPYAGWILIEEKAEGGDMLARIARSRPEFLDGFTRVCEGAGLALYRRGG